MLGPTSATIRLFLHVLGASVWVGGQLTLAGLVPGLRALDPGAPRAVARRFNRIAWPAFALLVATGIWNLSVIDLGSTTTERQVTVFVHVSLAALSGVSAAIHAGTRHRAVLAVSGALGALVALAALFIGVLLRST